MQISIVQRTFSDDGNATCAVHMWLVTEHFKCASVTEQLIYKFYLILIKLKSYRWLIPTVLGTIGMKCARGVMGEGGKFGLNIRNERGQVEKAAEALCTGVWDAS